MRSIADSEIRAQEHRPLQHSDLMWRRHDEVCKDLSALFDLLAHEKIDSSIAARFPLAEARRAHELLGTISVAGKIVFDARRLGDG